MPTSANAKIAINIDLVSYWSLDISKDSLAGEQIRPEGGVPPSSATEAVSVYVRREVPDFPTLLLSACRHLTPVELVPIMFDRSRDQLSPRAYAGFSEKLLHEGLNRIFRNSHPMSNFLVRQTSANMTEHLTFPG
jgi:hypothetical protein